MYHLSVYFPGDRAARATVHVERGLEVLGVIPNLLKEHPGCERVEVHLGATRLFLVDGEGKTRVA
jgi:hypothetical protein